MHAKTNVEGPYPAANPNAYARAKPTSPTRPANEPRATVDALESSSVVASRVAGVDELGNKSARLMMLGESGRTQMRRQQLRV